MYLKTNRLPSQQPVSGYKRNQCREQSWHAASSVLPMLMPASVQSDHMSSTDSNMLHTVHTQALKAEPCMVCSSAAMQDCCHSCHPPSPNTHLTPTHRKPHWLSKSWVTATHLIYSSACASGCHHPVLLPWGTLCIVAARLPLLVLLPAQPGGPCQSECHSCSWFLPSVLPPSAQRARHATASGRSRPRAVAMTHVARTGPLSGRPAGEDECEMSVR